MFTLAKQMPSISHTLTCLSDGAVRFSPFTLLSFFSLHQILYTRLFFTVAQVVDQFAHLSLSPPVSQSRVLILVSEATQNTLTFSASRFPSFLMARLSHAL